MKIAIITNYYYPVNRGGAEICVQQIAEYLSNQGHDVFVLTFGSQALKKNEIINNVNIHRFNNFNIYHLFDANRINCKFIKFIWHLIDICNPISFFAVSSFLKKNKIQILNTHNIQGFSVSVWFAAKLYHIKIIHTIRDLYLLCPKTTMFNDNRICGKSCFTCAILSFPKKLIANKVDGVIAVSNFILDKHFKNDCFINKSHITIYNPIIPNSLAPNFKGNIKFIFLFLGRISYEKGVHILVEAFKQLDIENTELWICGRMENKNYFDDLAIDLDQRISYKGFVSAEQIIPMCNCLVVPSLLEESFGRTVVEAMSHNKYVIGCDLGGVKEILVNFNNTFMFASGDVADLNKNMKSVMQSFMKGVQPEYDVKSFYIENISIRYIEYFKSFITPNEKI